MMHRKPLILAIHPTSRGFGYVVFEGPFAPYDWGTVGATGDKNAVCLRKIAMMLDRFCPETVVMEAYGKESSNRSERIARLCVAVGSMALHRGIDVVIYKLGQIKACFASVGAVTRQDIAEAVARHIEAFRHRMPKHRKPWQAEDRRMAMFCAAALALTHYQLDTTSSCNKLYG